MGFFVRNNSLSGLPSAATRISCPQFLQDMTQNPIRTILCLPRDRGNTVHGVRGARRVCMPGWRFEENGSYHNNRFVFQF